MLNATSESGCMAFAIGILREKPSAPDEPDEVRLRTRTRSFDQRCKRNACPFRMADQPAADRDSPRTPA